MGYPYTVLSHALAVKLVQLLRECSKNAAKTPRFFGEFSPSGQERVAAYKKPGPNGASAFVILVPCDQAYRGGAEFTLFQAVHIRVGSAR
jgi:hypothetical protein